MPAVVSSVVSPSLTVVRSGTSLMKTTHSSATAATTALITKTRPVASPYDWRTMVRTGAGRAARSRPAALWLLAAAAAAFALRWRRPSRVLSCTRVASTAPRTETPTAPPRVRKNATVAEAAPMSRTSTVFCTARTRFCIIAPRPMPMTAM